MIQNVIDNENIKCLAEGYELFQVLFDASKLLNFIYSPVKCIIGRFY